MLSPLNSLLTRTGFSFLFWSAAIFCILFFGIKSTDINIYILAIISFTALLIGILTLLYIQIYHPIKNVTNEMKALLTGKKYRKIMTKRRDEIGVMAHFFNEITRNLEKISSSVESNERRQKEISVAQEIQRDLLPKSIPKLPGLQITAKTRSASEIGGDTFDFFPGEKKSRLYIGDSTGHGVPAGIVMVMVDTLIETLLDIFPNLEDVIRNLNKYIKPHLRPTMFMTLLLAEWQNDEKSFKWIGAGHEHVIHFQSQTSSITSLPSGGIALGMLADNKDHIKTQEIILAENDFLVLYSDGITEAKNIQGDVYTLANLEKIISKKTNRSIETEELFEEIANDVNRFMSGRAQDDDMTLMVIKCSSQVKENLKSDQSGSESEW